MQKCDMDCFNCQLPVEQCCGGTGSQAEKTAYSHVSQRVFKNKAQKNRWFLVTCVNGSMGYYFATSNIKAKIAFCEARGISPNDYWYGVANLSARRLKDDEVESLNLKSK